MMKVFMFKNSESRWAEGGSTIFSQFFFFSFYSLSLKNSRMAMGRELVALRERVFMLVVKQ